MLLGWLFFVDVVVVVRVFCELLWMRGGESAKKGHTHREALTSKRMASGVTLHEQCCSASRVELAIAILAHAVAADLLLVLEHDRLREASRFFNGENELD